MPLNHGGASCLSTLFLLKLSHYFQKNDAREEIDDDNQTSKAYDRTQIEILLYSPCNRDMLAFHECPNVTASHKSANR